MRLHVLFAYATAAACVVCLALVLAARVLGRDEGVGLFPPRRPTGASDEALALASLARKVGAVALLLMIASKCAGSH